MTADEAYRWLIGEGEPAFDTHVVASVLALSLAEAEDIGRSVWEMAGYEGLPRALAQLFPHAGAVIIGGKDLKREEDEVCLHKLLLAGMSEGTEYQRLLAGLVARRAQRPNHLWQDLGLRNREELSALMTRHFGPLARRNRSDMKWKKFFFRAICSDGEYTLCTAPSCGECWDFDKCFGEETGEALLAHLRRDAERAM